MPASGGQVGLIKSSDTTNQDVSRTPTKPSPIRNPESRSLVIRDTGRIVAELGGKR